MLLSLIIFNGVMFPQDKAAEEITPEAINVRIEKYGMGDIIINTIPGADNKIQQTAQYGELF